MKTRRDVHHLVYSNSITKKPVYCGASFEEAKASAAVLSRATIALFVSGVKYFDLEAGVTVRREKPLVCPICKS